MPPGVCVCPEHGCYLSESTVKISGKVSPDLVAAELIVPEKMNTTAICGSPLECQLATYMKEVLQSKIDFKSEVTVGGFLHSRLEETPYRSVRGEQRNIGLFHADFKGFTRGLQENHFTELWQIQKVFTDDRVNFQEICMLEQRNIGLFHADFKGFTRGLQENHFTELWQIQKVFTDDRVNFQEICMLALFLKIPVEELVKMELPEQTQEERFDKEIFRLHEQGLKYPEIARRLDASYNVVKAIGGKRYGKYHKEPKRPLKSGVKAYDWERIDRDTLPLVKDAIKKLQGKEGERPKKVSIYAVENGVKAYDWERIDRDTLPLVKDAIKKLQGKEGERPKKVSIYAVEKMLGLPDKRIAQYLPKCREEIERHEETQEKYWAREVVWAVDTIRKNGDDKRIAQYLPKCREEIERHEETQEKYWAREVVWAVDTIRKNGDILNWKHIRNLTNMRKCREEIERHEETQEKYWAREVVWAVDTIRKNGDILNWKHIRNLTNMRKKNFIACATYLSEYSNEYLSIVNTLM